MPHLMRDFNSRYEFALFKGENLGYNSHTGQDICIVIPYIQSRVLVSSIFDWLVRVNERCVMPFCSECRSVFNRHLSKISTHLA